VQPGPALTSADIGAPKPTGATTAITAGRDYDLTAGGYDIWNAADQFRFAYRAISGDFDLRVRLASFTNTDAWAKAGLMARASLTAGSTHAFAFATPGTVGSCFAWRPVAGKGTARTVTAPSTAFPNTWLRLRRSGNTFTAYRSADGTTWASIGSTTLAQPATMYVGLAASSHSITQTAVAKFRDLGAA
jgi:regulation of enolase protein 1 (concanavalin A-like superfamily)